MSSPVQTQTEPGPTTAPVDYEKVRADMDPAFGPLYERCRAFTMTSRERMFALYKAVEYAARARIPGDIVECGVWRGGSMMLAALTLLSVGDAERRIHLYDTFEGMSPPGEPDRDLWGRSAGEVLHAEGMAEFGQWCRSHEDDVRTNLAATGFPADRLVFVRGRVEDTIPARRPDRITVLRLDTDWFESTYHELRHLYPLVSPGGVLIVDDYGHWRGSRRATDQYLQETGAPLLLNRIDYTGRIGVKASGLGATA